MTNRLVINKEIYFWAIEESRIDFDEIKLRFENIEAWISQEKFPTFRQVEKLANFLKVPLGYMFLNKPPITNVWESLVTEDLMVLDFSKIQEVNR